MNKTKTYVLIALVAACTAILGGAPQPSNGEIRSLSSEDLTQFLGPKSDPSLIKWDKYVGPDFDEFFGHAKPPMSGDVRIYFGWHPSFQPDPSAPTVEGQLGMFKVKWQKKIGTGGSIREDTIILLGHTLKAYVRVEAKSQPDVDRLIAELATLPNFANGRIPPGFRDP